MEKTVRFYGVLSLAILLSSCDNVRSSETPVPQHVDDMKLELSRVASPYDDVCVAAEEQLVEAVNSYARDERPSLEIGKEVFLSQKFKYCFVEEDKIDLYLYLFTHPNNERSVKVQVCGRFNKALDLQSWEIC